MPTLFVLQLEVKNGVLPALCKWEEFYVNLKIRWSNLDCAQPDHQWMQLLKNPIFAVYCSLGLVWCSFTSYTA